MALGKQVEIFRTRFGLKGSMEAVLDQTTDLLNISDNFPKRTDQGIRCMEALEMLDRRNSAHTPLVGRPFTASSTDQPPGGDAASHSILLPKARKQPDKQSDKRKASGATHPRQQKHGRILKHPEIASDDSEAVFVEGSEYEDGSVSDGDGGSVSSNRSDNDDADAFQKPRAGAKTGKNVARNTKRAPTAAAPTAWPPCGRAWCPGGAKADKKKVHVSATPNRPRPGNVAHFWPRPGNLVLQVIWSTRDVHFFCGRGRIKARHESDELA